MNWFEFQNKKRSVAGMVKSAASSGEDWKGQTVFFDDELNEVQRYKLDPYQVVIVKSQTNKKIAANIRFN